jgi:AbrB family looped-hinge helix DNA binding protein
MTVKGQITVPKELRDEFGWKPGDTVEFVREADGVKLVAANREGRGAQIIERLRQAPWNQALSTDALMALTRGEDS